MFMIIAGIGAIFALLIVIGVGYTPGAIHGYETGFCDGVERCQRAEGEKRDEDL